MTPNNSKINHEPFVRVVIIAYNTITVYETGTITTSDASDEYNSKVHNLKGRVCLFAYVSTHCIHLRPSTALLYLSSDFWQCCQSSGYGLFGISQRSYGRTNPSRSLWHHINSDSNSKVRTFF